MRIVADKLRAVVRGMCAHAGSDAREAAMIADNLVAANLSGHDSHGVGMMPAYIANVVDGLLKPNQHIEITSDAGPIVQIDGHVGYGQVIGHEAMALGITRAREHGVTIVALRRSHHLGRIGSWGEQCADAGMVSIHYVNSTGYRPIVAPFGGSDARYVTNPYCTSIPATDDTPAMILDMATSNIAMGKVRVARNKGVPVPSGSLIDPNGHETIDPGVMYQDPKGALLPFGNHKGYGLALACELLAGALINGGGHRPENFNGQVIINNMLSIIIDPNAVGDERFFRDEIDAITVHVKASPPAPGVEHVMVPGDPERKAHEARMADGIPVDDESWRQIVEAAGRVGMPAADIEKIIGA